MADNALALPKRKKRLDLIKEKLRRSSIRQGLTKEAESRRLSANNKAQPKMKGKGWLKFQIDKRRYQIGFPIGWGSFAVVYFARAHNFLEGESRALTTRAGDRNSVISNTSYEQAESAPSRNRMDLPEFVAVKVIKIKPKEEMTMRERLTQKIQKTKYKPGNVLSSNSDNDKNLAAVKELHTPNSENGNKMFRVKLEDGKVGKAPAQFGNAAGELALRKKTAFEKLGQEFDMELMNVMANKRVDFGLGDSDEGVEDVIEVGRKIYTDPTRRDRSGKSGEVDADIDDARAESWFKMELPVFFDDCFQKNVKKLEYPDEASSFYKTPPKSEMESDKETPVDVDVPDHKSNDGSSSIIEIKSLMEDAEIERTRTKSSISESVIRNDEHKPVNKGIVAKFVNAGAPSTFQSFIQVGMADLDINKQIDLSIKGNSMLQSQLRAQVQSVMTEICDENASKMEHESILDDAVRKRLLSYEEKQQYLSYKKQNDIEKEAGGNENKTKVKYQKLEDISLEIQALRKMRSTKFSIYLFDVVQGPKEIWLVTEFAHIGCLGNFCEDSYPDGVPPKVLKYLITPIFLAVSHLHKHKMIHRDLKPSNIVLTQAGVPKLCDYGMVKTFTQEPVEKVQGFCGTEIFAPPEAFKKVAKRGRNGRNSLKAASYYDTTFDTWSLAITMLSLLYGVTSPWEYNNGVAANKQRNNLRKMVRNVKHKKSIEYLSDRLEEEVLWLREKSESVRNLPDLAYVGLFKRLGLLELADVDDVHVQEVLLLMYYRDMQTLLTLKRTKKLKSTTEAEGEELTKKLNKLKKASSLDFNNKLSNTKLSKELKDRLVKGMIEFDEEKRECVTFVKSCLKLWLERPKVNDCVKHPYMNKIAKSWERFDRRMEAKLLEIAITGEFSSTEKGLFGGPYFNIRGEFVNVAKQVALKVHQRFANNNP